MKATSGKKRVTVGAGVEPNRVTLIDMPPEMLYQISESLCITNLAYLAATCRRLQAVLVPELYKRDHSTGTFRTLSWAAGKVKKRTSVETIERALSYWPPGTDALQCYFRKNKSFHGKSLKYLTPLMAAIQAGNLRVVHFLLSKGVDINQPEASPGQRDTLWYPIHHAMMMDYFKPGAKQTYPTKHKLAIIELLLNNGANPDQLSLSNPARKPTGISLGIVTPMHLAIKNQADNDVIQLLVDLGAAATRVPYYQVPEQRFTNITPISHLVNTYQEASEGHPLAVKALADNGGGIGSEAEMNTVTGHPLLLDSLSRPRASPHSVAVTKAILEGTWVNLQHTASNGDGVIVHFLKSHIGWKPDVPYDRRWALRHEDERDMERLAATACDTIDVLLEHGADINEANATGDTPLHIAGGLHRNYSAIFDHLIQRGANVKATTKNGRTVLHALLMGDRDADYTLVTRLIRRHRLQPYARDKDRNTFLHLLLSHSVASFNKWMCEVAKHYKKADFEDDRLKNAAGRTPLGEADYLSGRHEESDDGIQSRDVERLWIDHAFDEAEQQRKPMKECAQKRGFVRNQTKGKRL
ncbi:ankyrin repeat protein [Seiridium cupressi]